MQITVNIPDNQLQFFKELIERLDYSFTQEEPEITENQKEIVRERLKKIGKSTNSLTDWNIAKQKLKF